MSGIKETISINKRTAPKPVGAPKGHEAFLKSLETAGSVVTIQELDTDELLIGTIKHSDKYTISLKVTDSETKRYQVYVIFKHAIKKFWMAPENQPSAE
jgi:sRNA-binding regulator protein Hfq